MGEPLQRTSLAHDQRVRSMLVQRLKNEL